MLVYSGSAAERRGCRRSLLAPQPAGGFEVVLASYEVLMLDAPELKPVAWRAVASYA